MGNKPAVYTETDGRVEKIIKKLELTHKEFTAIRTLFGKYDKIGEGYVTRDDLFEKILHEPRNILGDSMLDFIQPKNAGIISFGEFLEFFYVFCLFEPMDMLKFIFFMFDPHNGGFVDKDEIRHFIYTINNTKDNATIEQGLQYLDDHDDGDARFEFYQIQDMHFRFQMLLNPSFRLLVQMRRASFGERWWELKNFNRYDTRAFKKLQEERAALAASKKSAAEA